jgi:alpha-ketoglutarate-dependent taurine dioxygenase
METMKAVPLLADRTLPLVVTAEGGGTDPLDWARDHVDWIRGELLKSGAMLFRGFAMESVADFDNFVALVGGARLEYKERSSPRTRVEGNVYTSTEHPAAYHILLHNENSYSSTWPMKVFFYCETPAESGGETPIADSRRVLARIDPEVRRLFADKGVTYLRNFSRGLGLPWTTAFQTEDKADVELYCRRSGIEFEWLDGNRLRTRQVRPAILRHPITDEETWFNHSAFFHLTSLDPQVREALLGSYKEDELPNNTYFGDGERIDPDAMAQVRAAFDAETVAFPWQRGDVMVLDNMLAAHGRASYVGSRRTLVAMTQPAHVKDGRVVIETG